MKTYHGTIVDGEHDVFIGEDGLMSRPRRRLNPRYDLANHSPDGFCWGYEGSGPAQLALAILADRVGPDRARPLYQRFKALVIARLNGDHGFMLSADEVLQAVEQLERAP